MRNVSGWPRALLVSLLFFQSAGAAASEGSPALKQLAQSFIAQHPAAQAARADLERAEAQARASGQPLYNPEIEVDYEDATDTTASIGLIQTMDWSGKRRARDTASQESMRATRAAVDATRQTMLGELLGNLSRRTVGNESADLAQQRVKLLADFLHLAERRYAAGDVGRTDVDLARLAVSEAQMQSAAIQADALAVLARLESLVQKPAAGWPVLPVLPADIQPYDSETLLGQHPSLRQFEAEASAARAAIDIARRDRRPDPTIGIRGGEEGDDTLIGVTVSIPLFVRNSFKAEEDAANADATRALQSYHNKLRRFRGELQATAQRYRLTRSALGEWQDVGQSTLKGRVNLLKRLWETGEVSTTDYLVQLQQTLDTRASAIELKGATWDAWVAWLQASGQTSDWLGL